MAKLARYTDWQTRLIRYLGGIKSRTYEEGLHDCALLGAGAVEAMTGVDFAAPYRGRYTTLQEGLKLLRADGFDDHVALAAHHLPEVPVAYARAGDLMVLPGEDDLPSLGVMQGEWVYVLTPARLANAPRRAAIRALRV